MRILAFQFLRHRPEKDLLLHFSDLKERKTRKSEEKGGWVEKEEEEREREITRG